MENDSQSDIEEYDDEDNPIPGDEAHYFDSNKTLKYCPDNTESLGRLFEALLQQIS